MGMNRRRLRLSTGIEVEAVTRSSPGGAPRTRCLLLHGNPGSVADWDELIPRLARHADVAAIDLPGFGKSPRTDLRPAAVTLDALAEHAVAAADALGWHDPIHLVGHSHGAAVAQTVAARLPERVAGLCLLATLGAPAHAAYRSLAIPGAGTAMRVAGKLLVVAALRPLNRRVLQAIMSDIFAPEPVPAAKIEQELETLSGHPEILLSMVHVTLGDPSAQLLAQAGRIRCPTLLVHGAEDALVPIANARAIHDAIAQSGGTSRFHTLPRAGHLLPHFQAPQVADLLLPHLTNGWGATP